jgi:hypothetical protein
MFVLCSQFEVVLNIIIKEYIYLISKMSQQVEEQEELPGMGGGVWGGCN